MEDQELLHRYSVTNILNNDFYSSLGLAHGKMRAVILFFTVLVVLVMCTMKKLPATCWISF